MFLQLLVLPASPEFFKKAKPSLGRVNNAEYA